MIDIQYIRASTLLIHWQGLVILTDPWFAMQMRGLPVFVRPCVRAADLPPLDLVLVSHLHPDHYDARAMRQLAAPAKTLVGPPGLLRRGHGAACGAIVELRDQERLAGENYTVRAHAVLHSGYENAYTVERDGATLLFAGDANYSDAFARIGRQGPPLVSLLPVGGTLICGRRIVMGPREAYQAALDLGTKVVVPIHLGGEWMSVPPLSRHPGRAAELCALAEKAGNPFTVAALAPGEAVRVTATGLAQPLGRSTEGRTR